MEPLIDEHREEIVALCRRFGLLRLDVFGSAAVGGFDPATSDVDLLAEFGGRDQPDLAERCFGFHEAVLALLGREVDLLTPRSIRNPYLRRGIERTREPLYAA